MQVSCQVNTKGFEAACLALAKVTGRSMEEVVTSELAKVIDKTIQYTKSSTKTKIQNEFDSALFTAQPKSIYTPITTQGKKRRVGAKISKNGKLFYYLGNRYPAQLWKNIVKLRSVSLKRKKAAVGLAKKSWWNIAQSLGLPVKGGRFTSAVATTGEEYPEDFSVSKSIRETDIAITFINSQPTVNAIGGKSALQSAVNGRVKYFVVNVKKGVFGSMQNISKRYPGLKLTS